MSMHDAAFQHTWEPISAPSQVVTVTERLVQFLMLGFHVCRKALGPDGQNDCIPNRKGGRLYHPSRPGPQAPGQAFQLSTTQT